MPDLNELRVTNYELNWKGILTPTNAIKQIVPDKPIIMLTGFGDMMKELDEIPADIDCLVSKPVTPAELREALAKVTSFGTLP